MKPNLGRWAVIMTLAIWGALAPTACHSPSSSPKVIALTSLAEGTLQATVAVEIAGDRHLMTPGYTKNHQKSDIDHLVLKLFRCVPTGNTCNFVEKASHEITSTQLNGNKNVVFENLLANCTYQIECKAYRSPGETQLISVDDAASSVGFTMTNENNPTVPTITVHLAEVIFDGIQVPAGIVRDGATCKADLIGLMATFAGDGTQGVDDLRGKLARFNSPHDLALRAGQIYVADTDNATIRHIDQNRNVTTVAGMAGTVGFEDGNKADARFTLPTGIAVSTANQKIYVADAGLHRIRVIDESLNQIDASYVTTLAGSAQGFNDGPGASAQFDNPTGLALSADENWLYVADTNNHRIRKVNTSTGSVSTLAGIPGGGYFANGDNGSARFNGPHGLALFASNVLLVADNQNHRVRRIQLDLSDPATDQNFVTSLAGSGSSGNSGGNSAGAMIGYPVGLAVDARGTVYVGCVTPSGRQLQRIVTSLSPGDGNFVSNGLFPNSPGFSDGLLSESRVSVAGLIAFGLATDPAGNVYFADPNNNAIRLLK